MANKLIVLISGANQGLGYFAAEHFARAGKYKVLVGSRDLAKGQKAADELVAAGVKKEDLDVIQLDVTSDESIEKAAKTIEDKYGRLDILVANAGISSAPGSTREHFQQLYNTNVFGHAICTDTFLPLLRKSTLPGGKRIVYVSSGLGQLTLAADKNGPYPGKLYPIYRSSKSALNMLMVHYADLLEEEGFVVCGICPGFCGTNLNAYSGPKDPRIGAKMMLTAAEAEKGDVFKKVVNEDGPFPW